MLEPLTESLAEDSTWTDFFRQTVLANMQAIALNLILPPPE